MSQRRRRGQPAKYELQAPKGQRLIDRRRAPGFTHAALMLSVALLFGAIFIAAIPSSAELRMLDATVGNEQPHFLDTSGLDYPGLV